MATVQTRENLSEWDIGATQEYLQLTSLERSFAIQISSRKDLMSPTSNKRNQTGIELDGVLLLYGTGNGSRQMPAYIAAESLCVGCTRSWGDVVCSRLVVSDF